MTEFNENLFEERRKSHTKWIVNTFTNKVNPCIRTFEVGDKIKLKGNIYECYSVYKDSYRSINFYFFN